MQPNYLLVFWRFPPGNASTKDSKLCVPGSRQVCQSFQFCGGVPGCWYYPTQSGMQKVSFGGGALIFPPGHPALALALFYQIVSANPCKTDAGRINKYDCSGCVGGSFWNFIRFRDFPEALQNLSVIFAHAKGVLCPTSQSRIRSTAPLAGEPLAKRFRFR